MLYKIEIKEKPGIFDCLGEGIKKDILDLGIKTVRDVSFRQIFILDGNLSQAEVERISEELLADKVSQEFFINGEKKKSGKDEFIIEVAYNPGVMDPVEESSLKAIRDLGIEEKLSVKTAKKYIIKGKLTETQLKTISEKLLYNKLIQHIVGESKGYEPGVKSDINYQFRLITVDLLNASDRGLEKISKEGQLFLNLTEMRQIQKYFKGLKRDPTDCELETIAQTWSEHCWHKTFRGKIDYREQGTENRIKIKKINNLLKSTIMKVTKELNKPWCVSVFKDNAGIIRFDDKFNICFKVETHNHPSALEPFGGANTGIGGVIRDPLGTGLGAKQILNTDVFCFGPLDMRQEMIPEGVLHPKRIFKGVVAGVRDYGNRMGIPTANGAIFFDERYTGNPLVYCGNVGLIPKDKCKKKSHEGDLILLVGGRTGRDGIHGATFSSVELTHQSEVVSGGAVQIGDPIMEKKVTDALLMARDHGLYNNITDCGAGGLSSAVGEMGEELGAVVDLEKVPLKYDGLSYSEIWISEAQERMVLSVPPGNMEEIREVFEREDVEATFIGEFTGDKRLRLRYKGEDVDDIEMAFLH